MIPIKDNLCHHFGLSGTMYPCRLCPTAIKLMANYVESLFGSPTHATTTVIPFSVH